MNQVVPCRWYSAFTINTIFGSVDVRNSTGVVEGFLNCTNLIGFSWGVIWGTSANNLAQGNARRRETDRILSAWLIMGAFVLSFGFELADKLGKKTLVQGSSAPPSPGQWKAHTMRQGPISIVEIPALWFSALDANAAPMFFTACHSSPDHAPTALEAMATRSVRLNRRRPIGRSDSRSRTFLIMGCACTGVEPAGSSI
jgi:hypothetical protein